ncbi:M48 family metallopeptidase [Craterilacuibacter sinensis]|uniref:M48 family metalloprotease n=1 Tax=Craterilacuibacter sinensis TaxID=2686017 RepID=A0A845BSL8_9NEIS|nr:M48 family metallopeptidase [Craterilacuibacter sinensis]MXR37541.1 M48 family metalloprotease [Craterilacuibacter sinensis]
MTAPLFNTLFLFALALSLCLRLFLAQRQIAHVRTHRNAVPAEFAASIPLSTYQHAADYTIAKMRLAMASSLFDASLLLVLTLGGGLQYLWQASALSGLDELGRGLVFVALTTLASSLAGLPFTLISTFGIEARYGFNKVTPRLFITDLLRSTLLSVLLGLPLLALVLWLMQGAGTLWWLWVWLAWAGFSLLLLLVYPTLIAPLFNRFQPLDDKVLAARIDKLLTRTGFKSQGIFVMDGSRRSSHGNAYFTGFGAAKRIVFFDTLLGTLSHAEVEAVLAHELGHFKKRHVAKRMATTFALALVFLFVLGQCLTNLWFYQGLGLSSQSYAIALVLFFMVMPLFTFPLTPLSSLLSRKHEYEADAFAASETAASDLITALVKLYRDNASTLTPDPLYSAFYDSHPPATLRIAHLKGLPA